MPQYAPLVLALAVAVGLSLRPGGRLRGLLRPQEPEPEPPTPGEPEPQLNARREVTDDAGQEWEQRYREQPGGGRAWVTIVPVRPRAACTDPQTYDRTPQVQPWGYPPSLAPDVRRIYEGHSVRWLWGEGGDGAVRRLFNLEPGSPVFPLIHGADGLVHWPHIVHRDDLGRTQNFERDVLPVMGHPDHFFVVIYPSDPLPGFTGRGDSPFRKTSTRLVPSIANYIINTGWRRGERMPSRSQRGWLPDGSYANTWQSWFTCREMHAAGFTR